jgi:hypothetical protein
VAEEFLVPVVDAELSDTDIIGSPLVTRSSMSDSPVGQRRRRKRRKSRI